LAQSEFSYDSKMKLVKLIALLMGLALATCGCASLRPEAVAPPEPQVGNVQDTDSNNDGWLELAGTVLACLGEALAR
jgi:hypothetical protein